VCTTSATHRISPAGPLHPRCSPQPRLRPDPYWPFPRIALALRSSLSHCLSHLRTLYYYIYSPRTLFAGEGGSRNFLLSPPSRSHHRTRVRTRRHAAGGPPARAARALNTAAAAAGRADCKDAPGAGVSQITVPERSGTRRRRQQQQQSSTPPHQPRPPEGSSARGAASDAEGAAGDGARSQPRGIRQRSDALCRRRAQPGSR